VAEYQALTGGPRRKDPACDFAAPLRYGSPAAPDYFSRRRRVMHRVLGYAVRKKRLAANPLSNPNLPEGWTAPHAPEDVVDPRSVGGA